MDRPPSTGNRRMTRAALALCLVLVLTAGDCPVGVSETAEWRLELEQLEDGTTSLYPRRGTVTMRLQVNTTRQPDPACEDEVVSNVTTFVAEVEALASRLQGATRGSADGSWNCEGLAATVRLDDGTTYELRAGASSPTWGWNRTAWGAGAREGVFRFGPEESFSPRIRDSHVDVLVHNRSASDWKAGVRIGSIQDPVDITYAVGETGAGLYAFEPIAVAQTINLSWPAHPQRRTGRDSPAPVIYHVQLIQPDRTASLVGDPDIRCALGPDHPDQLHVIIEETEQLECGDGWLGGLGLVLARTPLFLRGGSQTVQDTVTLLGPAHAGTPAIRIESSDPGLSAQWSPFSRSTDDGALGILSVAADPTTPRREHGLRVIATSILDLVDTVFVPVYVYELDVTPARDTLTVPPGGSDTTSLLLQTAGVFFDIEFSATNLPAGVLQQVPSFDPTVTTQKVGPASILSIAVAAAAPPGAYDLTVCAAITADPRGICHPSPLALVVSGAGGGGTCQDYDLRLDFDPVQVAAGGSDVVAVFVDRMSGFGGQVELLLGGGSTGDVPGDVLTTWAFSPNPVDGTTTSSVLSFTVRSGLSPGEQFELTIAAGSPLVETAPEVCTLPITFQVIQ